MSKLSLKIWNFKVDFRGGNQLKKMMFTKDLFSRRKLRKVFKKKIIEKKGFYVEKYEKNWKSKNGVKTAVTPLFKELWAIYVFFTNLKFDDYQKHQRKPAKVQKSWRIEFQPRKGSKIWKKLKVQKRLQKSSTSS